MIVRYGVHGFRYPLGPRLRLGAELIPGVGRSPEETASMAISAFGVDHGPGLVSKDIPGAAALDDVALLPGRLRKLTGKKQQAQPVPPATATPVAKDNSTDGLFTRQKVRQAVTGNQQPLKAPLIPPQGVSRSKVKGTLTALSNQGA